MAHKLEGNVDLHIHTMGSFDGRLKMPEILNGAVENNVNVIAITDHNNVDTLREYYRAHQKNLDEPSIIDKKTKIKIIPGVEITARTSEVANLKGNPCKVHLLVYGADFTPESPLGRLIAIKSENDKNCDFGLLYFMLDKLHVSPDKVSKEEIWKYLEKCRETNPGKNDLNVEDVWKILAVEKHLVNPLRSARQMQKFVDEYEHQGQDKPEAYGEFEYWSKQAPRYERLNIDASDLIKIAHASGGMVIMAHPQVSLRRTNYASNLIGYLIEQGIDGFELLNSSTDEITLEIIDSVIKAEGATHMMIITGGSDTHNFNKGNRIGLARDRMPISAFAVSDFLSAFSILEKRNTSLPTRKKYSQDVLDLVESYEDIAEQINEDAKGERKPLTDKQWRKEQNQKKKARRKRNGALRRLRELIKLNGGVLPDSLSPNDFGTLSQYYEAIAILGYLKSSKLKHKFTEDDAEDQENYDEYCKKMEETYSVNISDLLSDEQKPINFENDNIAEIIDDDHGNSPNEE